MADQTFGVGVNIPLAYRTALRKLAVSKSFTRSVTIADLCRETLDDCITPAEWKAAKHALATKTANPEPRSTLLVRGDSTYNDLVIEVARARGTTLGRLLIDVLNQKHGDEIIKLMQTSED